MPSVKQHSHSTTQPTMNPSRLGMRLGCVGRGKSATGSSGQLLTDPETTLPPLLVAPHACLDAVADADAALLGMTCSYNDMHISVRIAMSLGPPNRHSSRSLLQLDHRGKTHVVRPLRRVSTRSGRVSGPAGAPVAPRVVKNTLRG